MPSRHSYRVCVNFTLKFSYHACSFLMKIELLIGDSKLKEISAMAEAYNQRDSVALIGPASLEPTEKVSSWLSIPRINRALIGYSVTSRRLGKAVNFLRTPLSDDFPETVMAKLIKGVYVVGTSLDCAAKSCHVWSASLVDFNEP